MISYVFFNIKMNNHINLSEKDYENIVKDNGLMIQFIKDEDITYKLCKLAINQNTYSIIFIPTEQRTYELCKIAFEKNPLIIKHLTLEEEINLLNKN